jgi:hypothetical protein
VYEYQVYIAHTEHDEVKASEISNYLKRKGIHSILEDDTITIQLRQFKEIKYVKGLKRSLNTVL